MISVIIPIITHNLYQMIYSWTKTKVSDTSQDAGI